MTNQDNFRIYLNIKHWSHCWGGTVVKEAIPNPERYLGEISHEAQWLTQFLRNADFNRLKLERIAGTENGKNDNLSAQEFITRVEFKNPNRDIQNFSIITCLDGKPLFSMPGYESFEFGDGLFRGYKLEPEKSIYTLTLPYELTEQGLLDHTSFAETPRKTIIGAHIFETHRKVSSNSDLSNVKPEATVLLVYDPTIKIKKGRIK